MRNIIELMWKGAFNQLYLEELQELWILQNCTFVIGDGKVTGMKYDLFKDKGGR